MLEVLGCALSSSDHENASEGGHSKLTDDIWEGGDGEGDEDDEDGGEFEGDASNSSEIDDDTDDRREASAQLKTYSVAPIKQNVPVVPAVDECTHRLFEPFNPFQPFHPHRPLETPDTSASRGEEEKVEPASANSNLKAPQPKVSKLAKKFTPKAKPEVLTAKEKKRRKKEGKEAEWTPFGKSVGNSEEVWLFHVSFEFLVLRFL